MFQLILGISLLVTLLFVISLLVTEVAATYNRINQDEKPIITRFEKIFFKNSSEKNRAKFFLLGLSCLLAISFAVLLITDKPPKPEETMVPTNKDPDTAVLGSTLQNTQVLYDSLAEHALLFIMDTKWEEGKLYANYRVQFKQQPIWSFGEWKWMLLDEDGFLIRDYQFTLNDFVFQTRPSGQIIGLAGKMNDSLSLTEYDRIAMLKVILDKKLPVE